MTISLSPEAATHSVREERREKEAGDSVDKGDADDALAQAHAQQEERLRCG